MDEMVRKSAGMPISILLVEDDDGDAKAVRRAFQDSKIANPIVRAEDGFEALSILRGEDGRTSISRPYLMLVDLNMPRMDGIELVQKIREDPLLHKTVVFILTTSKSDEDKAKAYQLNVAGYILKENAGEDFLRLVNLIESYWKVVEIP